MTLSCQLGIGLIGEACRGCFNCRLQPFHELFTRQAGRNWIKELGDNSTGIAKNRMPWPEHSRVERKRTYRDLEVLIKDRNARLVIGRISGVFACAFGKNNDLATLGYPQTRLAQHQAQRGWAKLPLNGNKLELAAEPAVKRDG